MEKKNSYTPIAVGAVIALIGVLLGLYFAENAHERLAQYDSNSRQDSLSTLQTVAPAIADTAIAPMPLEPIATDIIEEEALEEEPMEEETQQQAEEPANNVETTVPEPAPVQANAPQANPQDNVPTAAEGEVDDFVEVDPAEEERRAAQQSQETEQ
ncbi:MAG: hypothetical protein IJT98_08475 [Prevotella sp.]|nr:hypothetical protein [Prevotella sp.]